MKDELILAKAILVEKEAFVLNRSFEDYFVPELDSYLFFKESTYNTRTHSYSGRGVLHNHLITEFRLQDVPQKYFNFVTVDIGTLVRNKTFLSCTRPRELSIKQRSYLEQLFQVTS